MTIEEFVIDYLKAELAPVEVAGSAPHPFPDEFVTVEKSGESMFNLIPSAQIHVKSWSTSRANAAALCARVTAAMLSVTETPEISRCSLDSSYNNPDLNTGKPRYSASFGVTYLF